MKTLVPKHSSLALVLAMLTSGAAYAQVTNPDYRDAPIQQTDETGSRSHWVPDDEASGEANLERDRNRDSMSDTRSQSSSEYGAASRSQGQQDANQDQQRSNAYGAATAGTGTDSGSQNQSTVNFDFDSAELNEDAKQSLDQLVQQAKDQNADSISVTIEGYTDTIGPEEYNQYLSKQRAEAVRSYLEDQDIQVDNWDVNAEGEASPVATNDTRSGREENRRAEVRIEFEGQEGLSFR